MSDSDKNRLTVIGESGRNRFGHRYCALLNLAIQQFVQGLKTG